MKTILVATDFSAAAHNACNYGAELAQSFNARLILVNAYQQVPVPVTDATVIVTLEDMRGIAQRQLEEEAKDVNLWNTINIQTIYKEGKAAQIILKAAKDTRADIIITGMKASGKGFRKVLGSTVTATIRRSRIPVIVVPEEAKYVRIDTIALANESDLEPDADVHVLDALREIAERFQPKLYMVRIAGNKFEKAYDVLNPPFTLTRMMQALDPVYECIQGKDIPDALNVFIEKYRVDMLAMLPHEHSLLEWWFMKGTTQQMVFETHVPLLILPAVPDRQTETASYVIL